MPVTESPSLESQTVVGRSVHMHTHIHTRARVVQGSGKQTQLDVYMRNDGHQLFKKRGVVFPVCPFFFFFQVIANARGRARAVSARKHTRRRC